MNKEKPLVLSDEQSEREIAKFREFSKTQRLPYHWHREAQRDADVAYYEPIIERLERRELNETFRKLGETDKKLDEVKVKLVDTELAIQQAKKDGYKQGVKDQYECQQIDLEQAKAEVAREIFEEIERMYMSGGIHPRLDGIVIKTPRMVSINEDEWQSLKSKYVEGK